MEEKLKVIESKKSNGDVKYKVNGLGNKLFKYKEVANQFTSLLSSNLIHFNLKILHVTFDDGLYLPIFLEKENNNYFIEDNNNKKKILIQIHDALGYTYLINKNKIRKYWLQYDDIVISEIQCAENDIFIDKREYSNFSINFFYEKNFFLQEMDCASYILPSNEEYADPEDIQEYHMALDNLVSDLMFARKGSLFFSFFDIDGDDICINISKINFIACETQDDG